MSTIIEEIEILKTDVNRIRSWLYDVETGNIEASEMFNAVSVIASEMFTYANFKYNYPEMDFNTHVEELDVSDDDDEEPEPFYVEPDDGA